MHLGVYEVNKRNKRNKPRLLLPNYMIAYLLSINN
jgi:hypothetical protein